MPQRLPLYVEPVERETLPSFFSRMAAINGTNSAGFAQDIGGHFREILSFDTQQITRFSELSGLSEAQKDDLTSWTGQSVGNVRMKFRGEVLFSRALRSPDVRGCPICIQEDVESAPSPLRNVVMRGDWLCRGVHICVRHRHPLVTLWTSSRPVERYDIGQRLWPILADIRSGKFDRELIEPSPYDLWLDQRLAHGTDRTWLAGQPLFAAMTFCDLLGRELLRGDERSETNTGSSKQSAAAAGFEFARQGPLGLHDALEHLLRTAEGARSVYRGALGQLYTGLAREYRDDTTFDGLRDIVREYLLQVWPVARGEVVLGYNLPERRLHSLLTASKEIGIGASVLNVFLTEVGAFPPDDKRIDSQKTFDAQKFGPLLEEIPTLVGPIALRKEIGATRQELRSLEKDCILIPRTKVSTIKFPWRVADGMALVEELDRLALPVKANEAGWETIQLAHKRTGISVGEIIQNVRAHDISLGKREGVFGYHSFVVKRSQLNLFKMQNAESTTTATKLIGQMSAAEFGRSVGLRGKRSFLAFVAAGHTPATESLHPKTRRIQMRMTEQDIEAFHKRFITPTVIEAETGLHRHTILAHLRAKQIERFAPDGQDYGPVYLREAIERQIRDLPA